MSPHISSQQDGNYDVLRHLDFLCRKKSVKTLLFSSEHHDEGHFQVALELSIQFQDVYGIQAAIMDLRSEGGQSNFNLKHRFNVLSDKNDMVFVVQDVKRNSQHTTLPELDLDGAVIVRSNRSVGMAKKRYVTNLIKDANLPVLGLIYNRV